MSEDFFFIYWKLQCKIYSEMICKEEIKMAKFFQKFNFAFGYEGMHILVRFQRMLFKLTVTIFQVQSYGSHVLSQSFLLVRFDFTNYQKANQLKF